MRSQRCILRPLAWLQAPVCHVCPFVLLTARVVFSKHSVNYRHHVSNSFLPRSPRPSGFLPSSSVVWSWVCTCSPPGTCITRLSRQSRPGFTVCLPGTILQGGPGLCSSTESRCSAFTSVLVSRGCEHQFNGTVDTWQPPFLWWCWARVAFRCCRSDC